MIALQRRSQLHLCASSGKRDGDVNFQSLDLCIRIIGGGKDGALDVRASRMVIDRSQRDPSDAKALRDGGEQCAASRWACSNRLPINCPYVREAEAGAVEAGQA
jgi:hypothetical protein